MNNFFQPAHILQLRELALKEVASQVERKVDIEVPKNVVHRHEKFLACISSNETTSKNVIRKTARLASYYNAKWFVLYVQTPNENTSKIPLDKQRHLINNFKLAIELGAEIQVQEKNIPLCHDCSGAKAQYNYYLHRQTAFEFAENYFSSTFFFNELMKNLSASNIDLVILS